LFVAVGCDDDGDKTTNEAEAGEGGESSGAGKGGKSTGGSSSNAGKGGTTAGSSTAGSMNGGGEGGAAGEGGGAGPVGGMAGESNTTAPMGGDGGTGAGGEPAGGAGGAPPLTAKSCGDQCEVTDDCVVDGALDQKVCDPVAKRCVEPFKACEAHDECVPWASSFTKTCANQADCDDVFGVCVTWQGSGYCASEPFDEGFCFGRPGAAPSPLLQFGSPDPMMIEVCLSTEGRCDAGECIVGCTALGGCEDSGDGDTCNEVTGLCECQAASECGGRACGADGHCVECATPADCDAGATGLDVCVNGSCGCSSPASCIDQTANATPVCE
jgi:hypothetical protein